MFTCRITGRVFQNDFKEIIRRGGDLRKFYEQKMEEEDSAIFQNYIDSNKNDLYLEHWLRQDRMYCKVSGKLIPWERNVKTASSSFSIVEEKYLKGNATRGTKRPEVGKKIGNSLRGKPKSAEHREKMSTRLKGIGFKIKFLQNKNIDIDFEDHKMVQKEYRRLLSEERNSPEYRRRFCISNCPEYMDETVPYIESLTDEQISALYSELQSVKSSLAMKNNPTMGNSKYTDVTGLKFNKNGFTTLTVRSSMEKEMILFFERNEVSWSYEQTTIGYHYLFERQYLVDFEFDWQGIHYFLEVKGSVRSIDEAKTMAKIEAGFTQFDNYILYQKEYLYDVDDLVSLKVKDFASAKLKHVYQYVPKEKKNVEDQSIDEDDAGIRLDSGEESQLLCEQSFGT